MRPIFILLLGFVMMKSLIAQVIPPIHCTSAINLCDSIEIQDTLKVAIDTTADEIGPLSCLTFGEVRGTWYTFGVNDTGYFRFLITPFDTLNDFDWALFRVDWGNCSDIFSVPEYEVSCDISGVGGGFYTTGATGLVLQGHQPAIHITSPALFYLYVTTSIGDTDAVQGYTIDFTTSDMDLVPCNEIGLEEQWMNQILLYPNPSDDYIKLQLPSGLKDNIRYEIISLNGQVVDKGSFTSTSEFISIHTINPGVYLVNLYSEKGIRSTQKLIIY